MRKVAMYMAGGAVAVAAALAAAPPAQALPTATGSFSISADDGGAFTVDTGDITATTSTVTEPSLHVGFVSSAGNLGSVIHVGDHVSFSNPTLPIPSVDGTFLPITPFKITIDGLVFKLDFVKLKAPVSPTGAIDDGTFDELFVGAVTDGGGHFDTGNGVKFSQACTQAGLGAVIGCGNSSVNVTIGPPVIIGAPEPASLTLLGGPRCLVSACFGAAAICKRLRL